MKKKKIYSRNKSNQLIKIIIFLMIIFSITFFLMYSVLHSDQNEVIINETVKSLEKQNENINDVFEKAVSLSKCLAEEKDIINIINESETISDLKKNENYTRVMDRLINARKFDENIYLSWFVSLKNYFLASDYTTNDEFYNFKVRPWFKAVQSQPERLTVFSKPYYEYNTGKLAISCLTSIIEGKEIIGYASVDISLDKLPEIMERHIIGDNGKNYLVSDTETIILTSEKPGNKKLISYSLIKPHVDELKASGRNYKIIDIYENEYIITHSHVSANNWELIQLADLKEMREPFMKTMKRVLAIFFSGMLIILAVLIYNVRQTLKIGIHFKRQAETDYLTGIGNRRVFFEEGKNRYYHASSQRIGTSVLMVDIDKFKNINDIYGHDLGDEAIKKVAETLKMNIRGGDVLCRYGGDEFSMLLYNVGRELAGEIAQRIIREVGEIQIIIEKQRVPLSITVGISVAGVYENLLFEEMVRRADNALISAKEKGSRIEFFGE